MMENSYEILFGKGLYIRDKLRERLGVDFDVIRISGGKVLIWSSRTVKSFPMREYDQEMLSDPNQLVEMYVLECVFS